jgi:arginine exporter protein ArgO
MQKIVIICAFFLVIMAAVLGLMIIFEMMSFETGMSNMLKFGGAIALLGIASALIKVMMSSKEGKE